MKRTKQAAIVLFFLIAQFVFSSPAHSSPDRPDTADLVIRSVTVVDVENRVVLPDQEIVVRHGQIAAIHPQPAAATPSRKTINGKRLIALPGFVNTHTHLWQHVGRSMEPSGNLQQWVGKVYPPAHYFTEDELYQVTLAAANHAALSGITTVADYASANFSEFAVDATCNAIESAGLEGAVVWSNQSAFLPPDIKALEIERLRTRHRKSLDLWMGPGSLSFYHLPGIYDGLLLAKSLGMRVTEHVAENVEEQREFHDKLSKYLKKNMACLNAADLSTLQEVADMGAPHEMDRITYLQTLARNILAAGLTDETWVSRLEPFAQARTISPIPVWECLGGLEGFLAIHAVWITPEDIELFRKSNVAVSTNPESNMYLSSGIAPVLDYLKQGIPVTLGTDGAASNDGIDFFSAMRACWNLQKVATLDTSVSQNCTAWEILSAATIHGARALGQADRAGSLTVGKEADIVLLSTDRLGMAPITSPENLVTLLIYGVDARDVDTVLSDGRPLVSKGKLVRYSEKRLARSLSETANTVLKRSVNGKTWDETFSLDAAQAAPNWFKWRSVKSIDNVSLTVNNTGPEPLELTLMFSGTMWGGTVKEMLRPETLQRFPYENPQKFWRQTCQLPPGSKLTLTKPAGATQYSISSGTETWTREGTKGVEQILILAKSKKLVSHAKPQSRKGA